MSQGYNSQYMSKKILDVDLVGDSRLVSDSGLVSDWRLVADGSDHFYVWRLHKYQDSVCVYRGFLKHDGGLGSRRDADAEFCDQRHLI